MMLPGMPAVAIRRDDRGTVLGHPEATTGLPTTGEFLYLCIRASGTTRPRKLARLPAAGTAGPLYV